MSAAIAAVGISAGVAAYSAHKAASASKQAAETQAASGQEALGYQQRQYDQQQERLAPYRALGESALGRLGSFQSFNGVPGRLGAGVNPQQGDPHRQIRTQQEIDQGLQFKAGNMPMASLAQPSGPPSQTPGMTSGMPPGAPQMPPDGAMAPPQGATQGTAPTPATGEPMVPMRAPDGTVKPIPQSQVALAQSRGAVIA